ncbi:MAG: exosortase N [Saprospiraceae bacterium]
MNQIFSRRFTDDRLIYGGAILLTIVIYLYFKPAEYLTDQFDFWLAILLSPFIIRSVQSTRNQRFVIISAFAICSLFLLRSNAIYYFAFAFVLLFFIEKIIGKLNPLSFFLIVISSALFRVIMNIWSFPIRLELSKLAGKTLRTVGLDATNSGNIIILNGQEFAVDAACMGLNLTTTALLLTLLILGFRERKTQRYWTFWSVTTWLSFAFLLSILANFTRLLLLVLFAILPDHPLHEVLGLVSIIVYVIVPIFLISNWIITRFPQLTRPIQQGEIGGISKIPPIFMSSLLCIGLIISGWQFLSEEKITLPTINKTEFQGFQQSIVNNEILELRNDSLLIYIKPPSPVYRSTHDPRICWQGSGYRFSNIKIENLAGKSIYTSTLTNGADQLYTAWWFAAENDITISEWDWRWKSIFNNRAYSLMNVSAEEKDILEQALQKLLAE